MKVFLLFLLLSASTVSAQTEAAARAWLTGGTLGANVISFPTNYPVVVSGTNYIIDCSIGSVFYITATANFKLWVTNCKHGFDGWVVISQDATGSRLMLYNAANIKTNANIAPSTAANAVDRYDLRADNTGTNVQITVNRAFK